MACGCKPTITPGVCNRTINLCRYSPMTVLAVNPVCTSLPYNLTVVGAIGNIIYSIVNDGKSIAINSDETTDELAYITYTYNCNGVQQTCTLTINVQDRIEGTHAIELNACSSTCSLGDTTYLWTGFTDGCVELMPGYSATDCQIKVLVYEECEENLNNVISLEVCCGACLDGCCQTTTWTWNPPTFNDNCDADCTMYPCTVYDPVTGNCVSSCLECQTCCEIEENVYACSDCCDNLGCVKENCENQPVCSSGECKCFIGQLEVPALPNGCCPAECTEDTIIPTCSTCVSGVIVPAPVCTETFVLNTSTCLCECPSGTVFDALTMTCIQVNCNVPGQTCPPCHNCVEGVCTPISCSGVPGMVNNPIGDGTVQNPCCIPDPCPNCIASLEVNKYCTDVLPRRANVSADATNYRIKFTQIQLNYLPFYSQVDCEYEALQAITQTNNLTNTATYEINYTNYVLDWVPVTPSGTTLIIPQSAGNGFLIKCNWKGREVIYEFIFEEGFNGSADQLVLGEYPIQVRKVKDLTCGSVYGLSGDCQTTTSWEFTQAALNDSGQFITDNPIVVHATGLDAEICVNAVTQFNGVVCEETQICADVDECQGACGCDPCNGEGTLFSTISQVTASDTLIFYASVFRDCGNGDELPIMFTCAPPTAVEYTAYINSGGDTLPDGCGTLPQMFDEKPACANCATFNCVVPGTSPDPATQLCGWWVDTVKLVDDSIISLNGANIEFSIKPNIESVELCFGANTECGYVCTCTTVVNPTFNPDCILSAVVNIECAIAERIESLGVTVSNAIGTYTIVYDINIVDEFAVSQNLFPIGPGTTTVTGVSSPAYVIESDPIIIGKGCLDYTITITDSSVPPCTVILEGCAECAPECTPDNPQWIIDSDPAECCQGDLVYCAAGEVGICIELPEECTYGTWDPYTCTCLEVPLACLGVLITRNDNDYTVTSIGAQSFVGATYLWSIVSGPGTFVTSTTLQTVTISNTSASTIIRAVVTFLDETVCTTTINGSTCVEGTTSVDLDVIVSTGHPDFEVSATLVSNSGLLANYAYQLVDPNLNFGEYFISADGVTYTTLNIINSGILTITQANYNIFVKYVVTGYGYIIKNININPFSGDVNTLSVTNVQFSSTTNTAALTVVGTTFTSAVWTVSGDIVIIAGQGTDEIEWLGCNGTITANVLTTCGSISANPVEIEGCGLYPCTPPTMSFELTPAYEGATSIFAIIPNVTWNNNTPTNITWTEVDPNSAITLTDNGLWALLSVDTSLIVDPTSVNVLIETDCGDLTDEIIFDECTILYEIQACQALGLLAVAKGNELIAQDEFIAININGTMFAPPSPIAIEGNLTAVLDIQTYLDSLVPIVGGVFYVNLTLVNLMVIWVSCNAEELVIRTVLDGIYTNSAGIATELSPPLTYATVLWSNPQQPPTSFLWALGGTLALEAGYNLTDQTILLTGDGDLDITIETADCPDVTPPTITIDPLCATRIANHAQTRVIVGGEASTLLSDVYIQYLGTGSMSGLGTSVTIDWGDGTIVTTPYIQNSTILGASMKISHTYASEILRYTILVTGTDSNSLSFSHTKVMSFNCISTGPRDPYSEIFYVHNSITNMNLSCCGACSQQWNTVRYALDPVNLTLGSDIVVSETLRVQGVDNAILPVEPLNTVKYNTVTTTLNSTPGIYSVKYMTALINSYTLVPYKVQSVFQFTTI